MKTASILKKIEGTTTSTDPRTIHAVYDCKALIALPPDTRKKYVNHLVGCLGTDIKILLLTRETSCKIKPPPYSVAWTEVGFLYNVYFDVQELKCISISDLPERLIKKEYLEMKKLTYEYHHMGIPTNKPRKNEKYSSTFKMFTTDGNNKFRIQWHRFEEDCPLHPLIQSIPHVAFKVSSIDEAIKNKTVLLAPYYPFKGFRVAMVEIDGAPVEFIETDLSEEDIWGSAHEGSVIYPEKKTNK